MTDAEPPPGPAAVLETLTRRLTHELREELLSLSVHGSYVSGDYHPGRSDVDVLAVLANDPNEETLAQLSGVHVDLVRDHPEWTDHVEVDYVSPSAVADILAGGPVHRMVRISPGEPLHLIEASEHYLLNWQSAQQHGRVLAGDPAREVLAPVDADHVASVVRSHLSQWPAWVQEAHSPGQQAYAVLTVCRAVATLATGSQLSKRAAADDARVRLPQWAALIAWARDWWYADGSEQEPDRLAEVSRFVTEVSAATLDPDVRTT